MPSVKGLISWLLDLTNNHLYHYCITRKDLPMGTLVAQVIHAAGESSPGNLSPGTRAIALWVENEQALKELEVRLLAEVIPHKSIREPDLPWNGQLMAIGLMPIEKYKIKHILSELKLLGA